MTTTTTTTHDSHTWRAERARIAALTRSRPSDDPDLIEARRRMRAARAAVALHQAIAAEPPFTVDERRQLAAIALGEEVAADVAA